jgi:hypothetical protein
VTRGSGRRLDQPSAYTHVREGPSDNLLVLLQHREDGRELGIDVEHAPPVPRISRDVNVRPPLISGESASLHRRDLEPRFAGKPCIPG